MAECPPPNNYSGSTPGYDGGSDLLPLPAPPLD